MLGNKLISFHSSSDTRGFTLIELIIVIVILGTLAVVAAPKFLDMRSEANKATLEGMGGELMSAAQLVYAKAVIQGLQDQPNANIDINGDGIVDLEIAYGYPSANRSNGVSKMMGSHFANEWTWSTTYGDTRFWLTTASLGGRSGQYVNQTAVRDSGCYILYDPATSLTTSPKISYVTDKC